MNKLRTALVIQLVFFAAWGGYLLTMDRTAAPEEIYLETEPVDPRDLLSGTYVALNYAINTPRPDDCGCLLRSGNNSLIYVKLERTAKTVMAEGRAVPIYEAAACADRLPDPLTGLWARGGVTPGSRRGAPGVRYGIEKFFVNENDPLKNARSGSVVAKVKLDRLNDLRLEKLLKKD